MKRIKIMGLCLIAVCWVAAAAGTGSASALPQFLPASGTFLSVSGKGTLQTTGGMLLICASDFDKGSITGPDSVGNVLVAFHGCKETQLNSPCNSGPEPEGLIKTNELKGLLGYINKTSKDVGLSLEPTSGTVFVEFSCASGLVKAKVTSSVIGKVSPINTKSTTSLLSYKQTSGKQLFTRLEGGPLAFLLILKIGEANEVAGEETHDIITFHQPTEVMG